MTDELYTVRHTMTLTGDELWFVEGVGGYRSEQCESGEEAERLVRELTRAHGYWETPTDDDF